MRALLITDITTRQAQIINLIDIPYFLPIDDDELETALEEYGIYENARYTIAEIIVFAVPGNKDFI